MPTPEYCLLGIEWWPLCMTKSEWSGWTQAIFSVIAIGAAACIAGWQYFAARSAANEGTRIRERARAIAMFELARRVHALTYAAKRGVEERKPGHLKWPIAEVERLRRIVERLPVLDLSSVPLITAFRDMDKVMNVVVEVCAAHMRTPTDGDRTAALQSLGGAQNLIRAAVDGCVTEVEMLTRKHDVAFSDPWFQRMHKDT